MGLLLNLGDSDPSSLHGVLVEQRLWAEKASPRQFPLCRRGLSHCKTYLTTLHPLGPDQLEPFSTLSSVNPSRIRGDDGRLPTRASLFHVLCRVWDVHSRPEARSSFLLRLLEALNMV